MKKTIIGGIVGGILIFVWQTLSWTVLDLHRPGQDFTPKQDSIISYLNSQFNEDGAYMVPSIPKGASSEEMEQIMKDHYGKPWAEIQYHSKMEYNMPMNMLRGLLVDIVIVIMLCWLLAKYGNNSMGKTFISCLFVGFISFLNIIYTKDIWYHVFDVNAYMIDTVVSWGLCGIWLGWFLNRKK